MLDEVRHIITFYAKPTVAEQRDLKNIFHLNQTVQKGMSEKEKEAKKRADKVWRIELEELFASGNIKDAQMEHVKVIPQFATINTTESAVDKFTQSLLDSADGITIYTFI